MREQKNTHRTTTWRLRLGEQRAILAIGDLFVSMGALVGSLYLWGWMDAWLEPSLEFLRERVDAWFYFLPLVWMLLLVDLYDLHRASSRRRTLTGIAIACLSGVIFFALVYLFSPRGSLTRWGVGLFISFAALFTLCWRLVYIQIFTAPIIMHRMLIIGAGKAGQTLAQAYRGIQPAPFHLLGFIDDDPAKVGKQLEGFPILAGSDQLLGIIEKDAVSDLVVAITGEMRGSTFQTILDAQDRGVEVTLMATLYEELIGRVPVHHLESDWLLRSFVNEARSSGFYEIAKRLLDVLGGLVGMTFCMLFTPIVAVIILIDSGTPVIYSQIRSGKGGKPFRVFKFRTMRQDAEKDGKVRLTREKDERITRVGNFLRRTHLDEFPQFWNVLRGEMSLVGPRSERPEWVAEFQKQIPFYRARLLVKPGVTGWAQVNYGYYATVEEMAVKLEYDLYYIKHRNLIMDIAILLRTVGQVISLRGR